jgi:putative ABC transport system ATP-binding protein
MPLLEVRDLRKTYPGEPPVESVRGIDLSVEAGDMLAISGASGSGKSTLLNLMAALDRPTAGRVILDGTAVEDLTDRQLAGLRAHRVGVVFQQFFLFESLTALDNVAAGLLYRGAPARERRAAGADALEQVGLGHRIHHRVTKLPGGERQRVAIARAVVGRPAIVFPTSPPATWTRPPGRRSWTCSVSSTGQAPPWSSSPTRVVADACHSRVVVRDGHPAGKRHVGSLNGRLPWSMGGSPAVTSGQGEGARANRRGSRQRLTALRPRWPRTDGHPLIGPVPAADPTAGSRSVLAVRQVRGGPPSPAWPVMAGCEAQGTVASAHMDQDQVHGSAAE